MRSEVNDMQMAFLFFYFFMNGGRGRWRCVCGGLALHISAVSIYGRALSLLPHAVQDAHVTSDGSLKFLTAATYRPIYRSHS